MATKIRKCERCPNPTGSPKRRICDDCTRSGGRRNLHKLQPDGPELAQAMVALSMFNGNAALAKIRLEKEGIYLSITELNDARELYPEKYAKVAADFGEAAEELMIILAREGAVQAMEMSNVVVNKRKAGMLNPEFDPSRVALNLSKVAVNNANLMLTLQGRPTKFTATENPHQLLKTLEALGVAKRIEEGDTPVEGSVVEVPDE